MWEGWLQEALQDHLLHQVAYLRLKEREGWLRMAVSLVEAASPPQVLLVLAKLCPTCDSKIQERSASWLCQEVLS